MKKSDDEMINDLHKDLKEWEALLNSALKDLIEAETLLEQSGGKDPALKERAEKAGARANVIDEARQNISTVLDGIRTRKLITGT